MSRFLSTPAPILAIATTALLLLAACGSSEPDGYAVADRVIESVGQPVAVTQPLVVDSGCERTIVVDEYGFEDEVVVCPDGSAGEDPTADAPPPLVEGGPLNADVALAVEGDLPLWVMGQLATTLPDPDLLAQFESLEATIAEIDAACGSDFDRWRSALDDLTQQSERATKRIDDGALEGYAGMSTARALARAFFERAVLETGCAAPGGAEPLNYDQLVDDGTLETTSRALLAAAELGRALQGSLSNDLFHYYSSLPNYEWLRSQTDPIELVVYGTSQAGAAIEVPILADATGLAVGNAFLPGSLAEVQQYWFPEVEQYIDPPRVIWLMGAIDLLIDCEPNDRPEQFLSRLDNRRRAFTASGWFRTIDPISVILGPPGTERVAPGNGDKRPGPDQPALDEHLSGYRDGFAATEFCVSRAEVTAAAVQRMVDSGRDVTIVGMPMSPLTAQLDADVIPETAAALVRLQTDYLPDGVALIDLTSTMQDDPNQWADLTHLTQSGADDFSRLLADALEGPGS